MFGNVRAQLGERASPEMIPGGVVLTGGASRLEGLDLLAGSIFGVSVRRSEAPSGVSAELGRPEYSTVLGVLKIGSSSWERRRPAEPKKGLLGALANLFKTNR